MAKTTPNKTKCRATVIQVEGSVAVSADMTDGTFAIIGDTEVAIGDRGDVAGQIDALTRILAEHEDA